MWFDIIAKFGPAFKKGSTTELLDMSLILHTVRLIIHESFAHESCDLATKNGQTLKILNSKKIGFSGIVREWMNRIPHDLIIILHNSGVQSYEGFATLLENRVLERIDWIDTATMQGIRELLLRFALNDTYFLSPTVQSLPYFQKHPPFSNSRYDYFYIWLDRISKIFGTHELKCIPQLVVNAGNVDYGFDPHCTINSREANEIIGRITHGPPRYRVDQRLLIYCKAVEANQSWIQSEMSRTKCFQNRTQTIASGQCPIDKVCNSVEKQINGTH